MIDGVTLALLLAVVSALLLFLFIRANKAALIRAQADAAAYDAFAARVGTSISPDRIFHMYHRLKQPGLDFIQNAKDFEETEKGLQSLIVKAY